MPTGWQILNSALKAHWKPYSTAGGRCDPLRSGYADCSGLCSFAMNDNHIYNGCGNSTGIELWATRNGGVYVSRQFSATHPGVMMTKWGYGPTGHIKMSTGDGRAYGTPSDEGHCAGFERFDARGVDRYFTVPGVAYEGAPTPPAPAPIIERKGKNLLHVRRDPNDTKGIWVYDGVRISPENAFRAKGDGHVEMGLLEFDRGMLGTVDPNNGIEDAPWFAGRIQGLRGNSG